MLARTRPQLLCAGLSVLTLSAAAQLNGTYTVGPAGNYTTLTAAITALQTNGVNGPVNMDIISGTYAGNWTVNAIPGTSAVNTVTFRSQAQDSTAVTLNTGGLITLSNSTFVRLRHLTLGSVVLNNATSDIMVSRCRFVAGATPVNTGTAFTGSRIAVVENAINGAAIGIRLNNITPSHGADMVVSGNVISGATSDGIIVERADGLTIERNTITSAGVTTNTYDDGIFVRHCINELVVARNTVNWGIGTHCIKIEQHTVLPAFPPVVENNMALLSGGNAAGAALSVNNADGALIRHNSARSTIARHAVQVQFCTNARLEGNIMQTTAEEVLMTQAASFVAIDRNVYYCTQANVIRWNVSFFYTWATWQGLGWDANSVFADPLFTSATDLHILPGSPAIARAPMPLLTATDRDGDARGTTNTLLPDAGADERTDACALGLSGTYVLGPSGVGVFPTFTSAVGALTSCGVSGPVVFQVESGTYTEQITIPQITGTSAVNTITFRSQAMDSAAVVLTWPGGVGANHTVSLAGGDNITFDRLTMQRTGILGGDVVSFDPPPLNDSRFIRFTHCRIRVSSSSGGALFEKYTTTALGADSLRVEHTRFEGGYVGMGLAIGANDKVLVQDNDFTGQISSCVLLVNSVRPFLLRRNRMAPDPGGYAHALMIGSTSGGFVIEGNRIVSGNGTGIGLSGPNVPLGGQLRIVNNMVTAPTFGLWITQAASGLYIDNNSFHAQATALSFWVMGTINVVSMRNNVFSGGMAPIDRDPGTTVTFGVASHNAFFGTGLVQVADWGGIPINTIAGLQAATGQFANSFLAKPLFFDTSIGDLHAYAMELDAAGTPIVGITRDWDGQLRHPTTPDIGADEFTPQLWNDAINTCGLCDPITSFGSSTNQWIYKDRKVVAGFNDNGQTLGAVNLAVYVNSGPVRQSDMGQRYLDRNWRLATAQPITTSVGVRLFFSGSEFATYAAADPLVTVLPDAGVARYSGVNENCSETDNPAGQTWVSHFPVVNGPEARIAAAGGTFYVQTGITNDGELYVTGQGQVLPVELLSFTGARKNEREVMLYWSTATEHNNAGFEVWRMVEGEDDFTNIAWVDGAGDSQTLINYELLDENPTSRTSYYKLRQVDNDGQSEWSSIVAVTGTAVSRDIMIYPNPARGEFFILGDRSQWSSVQLVDASGRIARHWNPDAHFDLGGIPAGVYTVRVGLKDGRSRQERLLVG